MPIRFPLYKIKRGDNLGDPDTWDRRFQDIDLRLAAREKDAEKIDGAVDALTAVALQRLNDTFTPLINSAEERLTNIGAAFVAASVDSVEIGTGAKTFLLTPETREAFVLTDFVAIRPVGIVDNGMIAAVVAYERASGLLTVNATVAFGAGETFDAWDIRITASPDLAHETRTDNPHAVSAAQVGAYTEAEADALLAAKAPLASPVLTGAPTAPTADGGTNTTQIATTAFVKAALDALVAAAPGALDTLDELAAALGDDANFAATMTAALAARLRVDADQGLTATEQSRGRANLGLVGRNLLINPHGRVNQRQPASNADDTYGHDRWVALTQTGAIAVSTPTDVEDGTPSMMRLTQSQAAAQRMGYAQIIEGANCKHLRGKAAVLSGRLRYSNAAAVRYAILEWTGTEDAVTSDVVADWTSATFTAGNFFLASNLIVRAVGSLTPAAATLTNLTALTATLGSSFKNLIVFVWTEGTAAQSSTLDLSLQLERGTVATEREFLPIGHELSLCRYYFERINVADGTDLGTGSSLNASYGNAGISITPKRVAPTFSYSDLSHFKIRVGGGAFVTGLTSLTAPLTANGVGSAYAVKTSAFTTSAYASLQGAADGYLDFSAEL